MSNILELSWVKRGAERALLMEEMAVVLETRHVDYFDAKSSNEVAFEWRKRVREQIQICREWKAIHAMRREPCARHWSAREGAYLLLQLQDAMILCKAAWRDSLKKNQQFLDKIDADAAKRYKNEAA